MHVANTLVLGAGINCPVPDSLPSPVQLNPAGEISGEWAAISVFVGPVNVSYKRAGHDGSFGDHSGAINATLIMVPPSGYLRDPTDPFLFSSR